MAQYDDYVWRLSTVSPQTVFSLDLPKDLIWIDETNWDKIGQEVNYSLSGALLIQEGVKLKGRNITLSSGKGVWITRTQGLVLMAMRDIAGLVITLKFVDSTNPSNVLFTYNTMFRHFEGALDIENIKDFDSFESDAFYIVKSIKLMETLEFGA